ncbi:MAG: hypothetical protein ACLPXB_05375 [Thiobacillaceae bacterium]
MSRLWPEELRGVMLSGQVALVRKPLLGGSPKKGGALVLPVDPEDQEQLLHALDQALPRLSAGHSRLGLVLAGSLTRYALTPAVSALLSVQEETALARQAFIQRYGDASTDWTVRHQVQGLNDPFICSAVETAFLQKLKACCDRCKIQLSQVEPLLAVVWRKARRRIPETANWLAVAEPGRVHLVSLRRRAWMSLASVRTHGDFEDALATVLQREASVLEADADATVWVMSAATGVSLPTSRPWRWLNQRDSTTPCLDFVLA